jgi:hypothetical protein
MRWLRASTARLAPRGERRPSRFRAQVHKLLDEARYVMQHEETRLRLRIARHIEFGEELHARE